jgi:integrase/recombinase XerD
MQEILNKYKDYLLARGLSLNYFNIIRIWLSYLEEQKITTINQETITQFFINNPKYKDSSKCQFIKAGRHYYTDFLQIPKEQNEWHKIKYLKVKYEIPDFLEEKDISEAKKQLITYFSRKITPTKIRALIDFLFDSGVRRGELLSLKREKIDLLENTAIVLGKGNKERMVCFSTETKKEMEQYFLSEVEIINAFNITLGKINYIFKLLKKYLNRRVYPHLIRHSTGRDLHLKGADIYTISLLFGHTNTKTTERYVVPNQKQLKELYKKIKK